MGCEKDKGWKMPWGIGIRGTETTHMALRLMGRGRGRRLRQHSNRILSRVWKSELQD